MRADVLVEHDQNVTFLSFLGTDAPPPAPVPEEEDTSWPRTGSAVEAVPGKTPAATRPLPARWSPRPCRVLADRFARSRLRADLRDWLWLVGLLIAGLICVALLDPSIDLTPPTGGPR